MWQELQNSGREVYQPAAPTITSSNKKKRAEDRGGPGQQPPHRPPQPRTVAADRRPTIAQVLLQLQHHTASFTNFHHC